MSGKFLDCFRRRLAVSEKRDVAVSQRVNTYLITVPVGRRNTGPLAIPEDVSIEAC
jgi:hypothetical protein